MTDSKIAVTERLRREGRWKQASEFRERERQRLRDEGLARNEAKEEAWRLMAERFPPVPEGAANGSGEALERSPAACVPKEVFGGRPSEQMTVAVNWVANHILVADVGPEDSPGPMAWSLLQFGRENPNVFWRDVWVKLLPSRSQIERQERYHDDGRALELVEQLLQECQDEQVERASEGNEEARRAAEAIYATCVLTEAGSHGDHFDVDRAAEIIQESWAATCGQGR